LITYALSHSPGASPAGEWESMIVEIYRGWLWDELQPRQSFLSGAAAPLATGAHTMPTSHPSPYSSFACSSPVPHTGPARSRPRRSPARHTASDPRQRTEPLEEPAEDLTPNDEDLILRSSIGQQEVLDIADKTTDDDLAEVMRRRRRRADYAAQEAPPDYTLEGTIASGRILSHRLMRLGHSYAADGFHHRARICFQAALESGHPDAQESLDHLAAQGLPETAQAGALADAAPQRVPEPTDPTQLIELGVMLCHSGDENGARQAFAQAVSMSSAHL